MTTQVTIPQLGESISEAVVSTWLKNDGEYVRRDEDIVELETDKVTQALPAPAAGVLKHRVKTGEKVLVGAVIAAIDESAPPPAGTGAGEAAAEKRAGSGGTVPASPSSASRASSAIAKTAVAAEAKTPAKSEPAATAVAADDVRITPLARKLAEEKGVDPAKVAGTGPGGRIREQDILAAAQHTGIAPAPTSGTKESLSGRRTTRTRMSQLRQRIAVRLVEAQHTAAMLTTFNECDMTKVMALRAKHKDAFEKAHGVKLGFMSFFVKACVSALQKVPAVNSFIVPGENGPELESHDYCDIAVAVGTEKGLVVPVLRDCQNLSFAEIEKGINALAEKARAGSLTLEDMQGGTFTISNGGVYGSMMSTPILNPPQSGILGMHNIIRRPVENPEKPGSGEVVVRPMMYLALSYDHRVVDGAGAVGFLKHVKECIEEPERLMLGV